MEKESVEKKNSLLEELKQSAENFKESNMNEDDMVKFKNHLKQISENVKQTYIRENSLKFELK